ncbi:MAG: adenylosuccinate lyase [Planctomycetia bacterium]
MSHSPRDEYQSPLSTRYAGQAMRTLFGERRRIESWRRLWIWLAEAQRELGLDIREEQVAALEGACEAIDFEKAAAYEARFRHDVMAHVHAFGDAAPEARGVIHLGATSCYVTDNADALLVREALGLVAQSLAEAIAALERFARRHVATACLAYTHFQPAQPTTMGKRACLWLQDLVDDLHEVERAAERVPFLGSKGTTGTQASFLTLFGDDARKVEALDRLVAQKAGFAAPVAVSGQTYSRRADWQVLSVLGGVAISAARFGNDVRLLSGHAEVSEPFEQDQVGSSAMAYKRNPMRSERLTALARHVLALVGEAGTMAQAQWLERTLDDSAARRIVLPEGFLATDAVLRLVANVGRGLVVNEAVVRARLRKDLPFMATEEILMRATAAGGDRQALHERIRVHSLAARERLLAGADTNDLAERLCEDPAFAAVRHEIEALDEPERFTGLATQQAERFLDEVVAPALAPYRATLGSAVEIKV